MAIVINETNSPEGDAILTVTLTNGELNALKSAQEKRKLKDMKSLFEFILAVFVTPEIIFVQKTDSSNRLTIVHPAEDLVIADKDSNHG